MPHAGVLTRGDRRRNERLARLRSIVRRDYAVVAVDLASAKQAVVVTDHDSVVLGRRMFTGDAWVIDEVLDWAVPIAAAAGFAGVVLGCEPTGHRWKPLLDRARARGIELVCVNPMLVHRGREEEDFTRDRSDFKDATIIAKKVSELRCYVPYPLDGHWCRLRHLGARRDDQLVAAGAARQALRDLLECAWPAVLRTAAKPLEALTWRAAMAVSTDPGRSRRWATRRSPPRSPPSWAAGAGVRRNLRILRAIWAAAQAPGGVGAERDAALERAADALRDWHRALGEITDVETRMLAVLDALESDRAGHHAPRAVRGRCRGDPGRDRRPGPLRLRPHLGQTRRAVSRGPTSPAPSPAPPRSPAGAGPGCAPPPGVPSGVRCGTTRSTPPASTI